MQVRRNQFSPLINGTIKTREREKKRQNKKLTKTIKENTFTKQFKVKEQVEICQTSIFAVQNNVTIADRLYWMVLDGMVWYSFIWNKNYS